MPSKSTAPLPALPVDPLVPEIVERLRRERNLVLQAPPGAGKTTRVPPALLALGGQVVVLEPRRLAARLAARRVAFERKERLGETVGYQIRFEEVAGPRTRLRFMTEGVLVRRLLTDPTLQGVCCVVLDEFHERHLETDLALALLYRLQRTVRPDLRLVVMSATLDAAAVAAFLDCSVVRSEGRQFELSIRYTPASAEPLESQVAAALETLFKEGLEGDVLVFLPGAAEIRRAMRACEATARRANLLLLPLHGDLPLEDQERAIAPAAQRKVILATNVAESSITIEGVTAVIDSGLARIACHSTWSGLPRLEVRRVSKASANQRAGRAGRTAPGRVIRLYPLEDFARRPEHETPEILRVDLSETLLALRALHLAPEELDWLDTPPADAWQAAQRLLIRLGALDQTGQISALGMEMARLPLQPRLARLLLEARRRGAAELGCAVAAVLSTGERVPAPGDAVGCSDLLWLAEAPRSRFARQLYGQLRRLAGLRGEGARDEQGLLRAVLAAFPDRVARRLKNNELALATGGTALLSATSAVRNAEFLVAVEVEERQERGLPLVRLASAIEPEWLLDLFPERIREESGLEWNASSERVEHYHRLMYDQLAMQESRQPGRTEEAAAILAERAREAGLARFVEVEEVEAFLARVEFAAAHAPVRTLTQQDVAEALRSLCYGISSFAELEAVARNGGLLRALEARLGPEGIAALEAAAPARIRLPSGRRAPVRYARGRNPSVAAQIQELFGQRETPRLAGGKVALTIELLGPNRRPVQTTTDLESFWKQLYPVLRRQLSRRYPRHDWPEDPLAAKPSFR